jgi:hypothetical protein
LLLRQPSKSTRKAPEVIGCAIADEPLSRSQVAMRRYEDWRIAHEIGVFHPETRMLQKRSVAVIAATYRVTPRAVQYGIQVARKAREEVARASNVEGPYGGF